MSKNLTKVVMEEKDFFLKHIEDRVGKLFRDINSFPGSFDFYTFENVNQDNQNAAKQTSVEINFSIQWCH